MYIVACFFGISGLSGLGVHIQSDTKGWQSEMKLIFVYNANSGTLNTLFDIGHKIISPESYECKLCQITHGNFKERNVWKKFRETSDLDLIFLHKDEFEKQYESEYSYPNVLKLNGKPSVFISTQKLNEISKPETLIEIAAEFT